jgi:hypothetical protein
MIIIATWRRAASLFATGLAAVLLTGCVVRSDTSLVAPEEAAQILPASFSMAAFDRVESTDVWKRSDDEPAQFTLVDGGYAIADGTMSAYFVDMGDPKTYLIATVDDGGARYGTAALGDDGILVIRMLLAGEPEDVSGDFSATAEFANGGITIDNRADRDTAFRLIADGTLSTEPLVAYVGTAPPPASIVKDGDWYRGE